MEEDCAAGIVAGVVGTPGVVTGAGLVGILGIVTGAGLVGALDVVTGAAIVGAPDVETGAALIGRVVGVTITVDGGDCIGRDEGATEQDEAPEEEVVPMGQGKHAVDPGLSVYVP